jgi:hypothetical protein
MRRYRWAIAFIVVLAYLMTACGSTTSTTASGIPLNQVPGCGQSIIAFEDDGVAPPAMITDWPTAAKLLGFTPLLPPRVPDGACLASGGGVVRNPIFGSRFTLTYELPYDGALSIAEVPTQQNIPTPQCSAAQPSSSATIATCQQTQHGLNITIASSLSADQIRALLATLQPRTDWVPGK